MTQSTHLDREWWGVICFHSNWWDQLVCPVWIFFLTSVILSIMVNMDWWIRSRLKVIFHFFCFFITDLWGSGLVFWPKVQNLRVLVFNIYNNGGFSLPLSLCGSSCTVVVCPWWSSWTEVDSLSQSHQYVHPHIDGEFQLLPAVLTWG